MPILAFHYIDQNFHLGVNSYSPRRFRRFISIFQEAGYEFVQLADYVESTAIARKSEVPERGGGSPVRQIALTFDDGYESFYEDVIQILHEFSIPATVFIPTGHIGRTNSWDYSSMFRKSNHLSAGQIREMTSMGIAFGSHGHTHTNLVDLSDRLLKIELERSKLSLKDIIGQEIKFISYPFGKFNDRVERHCLEAGYLRGFSLSHLRRSRAGFSIPRFPIYSIDTPYSISKKISSGALNKMEIIKDAIINSYSYGTILLNRIWPSINKGAY